MKGDPTEPYRTLLFFVWNIQLCVVCLQEGCFIYHNG